MLSGGSAAGVHPPLRILPIKSCFLNHYFWGREVKKIPVVALVTIRFPAALSTLPVPASHIIHTPWSLCLLSSVVSLILWEAAQSSCRSSLEEQES